ncbi:MAG TPA: sensor domain-containing diguanylate cyclase [Burkholderiaceae bacterium]
MPNPLHFPAADAHGEMFMLAPISLWLEDFSGVKTLFEQWRAEGVTDLRAHLTAQPALVAQCSQQIRVIEVNQKTLTQFGADSLEHLVADLSQVFRDDMLKSHVEELSQLWQGRTEFHSQGINYTLAGRRMDIRLKGVILPGHESDWKRVLLAIEDVTEQESAKRKQLASEAYARGLFEHSPVSLWVEDFSAIKRLMDEVRERGITDFRTFTDVHPDFVERCMSEIRVIDVNRQTLAMFGAKDKATLLANLHNLFRDEMRIHFREQLIDLWQGHLFQQREVVNYSLNGDTLHVYLQFSVLPGHEESWSQVQVALTDITARKKAEAYLEYLGKHDVLTKLHNRAFYVDELNRLERKGPFPVSILIIDLNHLKSTNDQLGHAAGDELLRRTGEVLASATDAHVHAARIGGDEFAILLPGTEEAGGLAMQENIRKLIEMNNQFYAGQPLSLAMGAATSTPGERLEDVLRRADQAMYEDKKACYERESQKSLPG